MQVFITYIVKVVLISGILYGYYWMMLRNKKFHQYNRFYLLSAMLLSITLPFVRFSLAAGDESMVPVIIQKDMVMDSIVVAMNHTTIWTKENILYGIYFLMVSILSIFFIRSLIKIYFIKRKGTCIKGEDYVLVQSDSKGTPFSFFKNIFWSPEINLHSREGEKMFRHELTHVRQYHSIDKLIANLIQIFFWFNPFFGAIKRELNIVHEFLADSEAFEESDAESFSGVILGIAYPGLTWPAINSFFHSPIKRRLVMLIKNNKQKVSYLGRIMILPLTAFTILFFAEKVKADSHASPLSSDVLNVDVNEETVHADNISDSPNSSWESVILPLVKGFGNDTVPLSIQLRNGTEDVLYIVDGKVAGKEEFAKLSTDDIESITVYKNNQGMISKYGSKAGNGVVEIITKSQASRSETGPNILLRVSKTPVDVVYVVDGKVVDDIRNLNVNQIQSISVLKNSPELISKFGEDAKNGVIEIETKKLSGSAADISVGRAVRDTLPQDFLFTKVETEAQFPGGARAYQDYIAKKLAEVSGEFTAQDFGECIIKFTVKNDGTVSDVYASTMKGTRLAEAFIDAIRRGPKWVPAQQNGRYVSSIVLKSVNNKEGGMNVKVKSEAEMEKERAENQRLIEKYRNQNNEIVDTAVSVNVQPPGITIFTSVDKEAQFPGGVGAWQSYITKLIAASLDKFTKNDYGTCIVRFIVHKTGDVSNVHVTTMEGTLLARIAVDAIQKGPKWIPAQQNGQDVNAYRMQPITLKNPNF